MSGCGSSRWGWSGFFWYVTGFFVLALVTAWAMPETRSESHLAREYGRRRADRLAACEASGWRHFPRQFRLISLPQGPGPHHA